MSFGLADARSLIGPLTGKTATFILPGREENLAFARTTSAALAGLRRPATILDLDALYSSNSESIFEGLEVGWATNSRVRIPDVDSQIEGEVAFIISGGSETIIIDSLNTLYHLLAANDGSSRTRALSFTMAALSYLARTASKVVILTMYRREGFGRSGAGRSISGLSDVAISVERDGDSLKMRTERGAAWPGGRFSIRTP